MEENAGTVQQKVTELSDKYVEVYKSFKSMKKSKLGLSPDSLALHDILIQKFVWESVYENVKAYIEDDKNRNQ